MQKKKEPKEKKTVGARDAADSSAIDAAIREIHTKFGDESIMKLGDAPRVDIDVVQALSASIGHSASAAIRAAE